MILLVAALAPQCTDKLRHRGQSLVTVDVRAATCEVVGGEAQNELVEETVYWKWQARQQHDSGSFHTFYL